MLDTDKQVPDTYKPLYEEYPHSYQLSGSGINILLSLLSAAQVLDENLPMPELSKLWPPEGFDEERAEELVEYIEYGTVPAMLVTDSELVMFKAGTARMNVVLSVTSNESKKVPIFKLQTNDGWIITPEECNYMMDVLSPFSEANPVDFEGEQRSMIEVAIEWRSFVEVARHHAGFRVD